MKIFFKIILIGLLILVFCLLIKNCQNTTIQRPNPLVVGYRELVKKTTDYSIYRNCEYTLSSVTYDTIRNRKSTIEPSVIEVHSIPNKVDLNDTFDSCQQGDIDWNYSKIDKKKSKYLDSLGIYWDGHYGCYRKH